jgi:transposase
VVQLAQELFLGVRMSEKRIERVDSIPLIIYWLLKMQVAEIIDRVLPPPHNNRCGLSYGQLGVLFVTYVLYLRDHRLCAMEEWLADHRRVLTEVTGWEIGVKEATDDRLGDLLTAIGEDEERGYAMQRQLGQRLIYAYALPTEIARYDTTTFSVHHVPKAEGTAGGGLLAKGYSKEGPTSLLQFKQSMGALDPAGIPILTETLAGQKADDPLYVPAWQSMVQTVGHPHSLFIADCKGAALNTRAEISRAEGQYLFPMPMTGEVPQTLHEWVFDPANKVRPLTLVDVVTSEGQPKVVGRGFEVNRTMSATLEDGTAHTWAERWLVTRSDALAQRRQKTWEKRLQRVQSTLNSLQAKKGESAAAVLARAESIVKRHKMTNLITVQVQETVSEEKRYIGPGRPGPNRPFELRQVSQVQVTFERDDAAWDEIVTLAGWRIYVTNVLLEKLSLDQAVTYYRDEWLIERGYHRFKAGSLPVLPLWIRLPERIRGLMILLLFALQALTLMDFVARRELARGEETLAGLVPGNPKMKTARPTAERMLARFQNLHLMIEHTETSLIGELIESLTPLQRQILGLLGIPETVYEIEFSTAVLNP